MKIKNLRGECQHCGGLIEFHAEHAGTTGECPHCNHQTELMLASPPEDVSPLRRKVIVFSLVGLLILLGGLIGVNMALKRARQMRAEYEKISPGLIARSPTTSDGLSTKDDFGVSQPVINRSEGSVIVHAIGSVTNTANRQRFGVKVELELLDDSGLKLGTASDYQKIMEPGAEWKYRALVVEKKATSAKVVRISESK